MLALLLFLALQDTAYIRVESLLAAHNLPEARRVAERLVRQHPREARAHVLLGRVWYVWPIFGRYQALDEFRTAARLAPSAPEPLYWQAEVGDVLGSDEGDAIAREAILKIFELAPDYQDCWRRFQALYHNEDIWRRAERGLARHSDDAVALERRAEIALALEEPRRADSLAALVLAQRAPYVPGYLLHAEANFQAGRDAAGFAWYDSALIHADLDWTGALWENVRVIASPEEMARHDATRPGAARQFFEWFWGKRDPNLLTRENERIAEHFRRLAVVRRYFHLLHPRNLFHRSAARRALAAANGRGLLAAFIEPGFPVAGAGDSAAAAGRVGPDLRDSGDTAGAHTLSHAAGWDARGLLWIRHGPPDQRLPRVLDALRPVENATVSPLDLEGWLYHTPEGPASIGFVRGSAGLSDGQFGGDFIFFPTSRYQVRSARLLLETDRTTLPAPLAARVWGAFFRSPTTDRTDVYYKSAPDTAAAVLWDEAGEEVARATGPGLLRLSVPPGRYVLGLDADSAGVLGRLRGEARMPDLRRATPALSSLLLAPSYSLADRVATLDAMPATLTYPAGSPLTAYAEIYGLSADAAGIARYVARYSFAPVRSLVARAFGTTHPVIFELTREAPAPAVTVERLVIEPGRVPPGRYRVTLRVTDVLREVQSETVAVEIIIR